MRKFIWLSNQYIFIFKRQKNQINSGTQDDRHRKNKITQINISSNSRNKNPIILQTPEYPVIIRFFHRLK